LACSLHKEQGLSVRKTTAMFTYQYRGGSHYAGHAAEIEEWLATRSSGG